MDVVIDRCEILDLVIDKCEIMDVVIGSYEVMVVVEDFNLHPMFQVATVSHTDMAECLP